MVKIDLIIKFNYKIQTTNKKNYFNFYIMSHTIAHIERLIQISKKETMLDLSSGSFNDKPLGKIKGKISGPYVQIINNLLNSEIEDKGIHKCSHPVTILDDVKDVLIVDECWLCHCKTLEFCAFCHKLFDEKDSSAHNDFPVCEKCHGHFCPCGKTVKQMKDDYKKLKEGENSRNKKEMKEQEKIEKENTWAKREPTGWDKIKASRRARMEELEKDIGDRNSREEYRKIVEQNEKDTASYKAKRKTRRDTTKENKNSRN